MQRILLFVAVIAGIAVAVPRLMDSHLDAVPEQPAEPVATTSQTRSNAGYSGGRDVVLKADQNGHFSGTFKINGRKLEGMIDTGATTIVINRSTARRVGISLTSGMFKHKVGTANGTVLAARVTLKSVGLQSIRLRDVDAYVLEDESLSETLIGMSFLSRLKSYRAVDGQLVLER